MRNSSVLWWNAARSSTIAHRYCNTFQLTHMPREDHERSRRSIELSQQWRPKEIEKTRNLLYSAHNFASTVSFGSLVPSPTPSFSSLAVR